MRYLRFLKLITISLVFIISSSCDKEKDEFFTLTVNCLDKEGKVTVIPQKDLYEPGDIVQITVDPGEGYAFTMWEGNIPEGEKLKNEITITLYQDIKLKAVFKESTESPAKKYTLNIEHNPEWGSVEATPQQTKYDSGYKVTLWAIPKSGFEFVRWAGDIAGTNPEIEVEMGHDLYIQCVFQQQEISQPDINIKLQGLYQIEDSDWLFTADVIDKSDDSPIENIEIIVDGNKLAYDDFFNNYKLNLSRPDNNSPFKVDIRYAGYSDESFTINPSHFPQKDNITFEESSDKKSFTINWVDVGTDGYRITKEVSSQSTNVEVVVEDFITTRSYSLVKDDIWNSNVSSNQYFNTFQVWVSPVNRIMGLGDQYSNDSFIEILGKRSGAIQGKR